MENKDNQPETYPFSTVIPVRITDINYGKHLGHVAVVGIFHNVRVLFLNEHKFDELNVDGYGVILVNSSYSFKSEAYFDTKLMVNVGIGEYSKLRFNFLYKAINIDSGKEVVCGKEEMAFFDYSKKKVVKIPSQFLDFCEKAQVTIGNQNLSVSHENILT